MTHSMFSTPVETEDWHTGGEPFRIVAEVPVELPGATVAEKRMAALRAGSPADQLRALLVSEPRGHADMYGGFLTEPDDDGADFGVLFWHAEGFSTACGHGTIALGAWAVTSGRVPRAAAGPTTVRIDVPSGRVAARVHTDARGSVTGVDFANVASARLHTDVRIETSRGPVSLDIGYGGALYAHVRAADLGLAVRPEDLPALISAGREIKALLAGTAAARFAPDDRLSGIYGTIFYDELDAGQAAGTSGAGAVHQRNVTIFADGQVDRSPCGSGTASRVAVLAAAGRLGPGDVLVHDSIVGSRFTASYQATAEVAGQPGVLPVVTGTAHLTGRHSFIVDPDDELVPGFVLR